MTRARFYKPIQSENGPLVKGATVRVLDPGTASLITDPLYAADSGTTEVDNPQVNTTGIIDFWLDEPRSVRIGITPEGGNESFFDGFDVGAAQAEILFDEDDVPYLRYQ